MHRANILFSLILWFGLAGGAAGNAAIDADNDGVFDSGGQIGADIDGEAAGDFSGRSVSLSSDGQVVAIGAYDNDGNGNNAGHVRLYALDDGNWVQRGSDIDGEAAGDTSGHSVSLSSDGSVVAIGAPYSNGNGEYSGHVRLYAWNGRDWEQRGSDIDGEAVDNYSGISVSLSSDGSVVAIGADYNNDNGEAAGHVRLYAWDGRSWEQRGTDINGEATGDGSGYSVSLSSDGGVVAIGAPGNDGNDVNAGHVRLYSWNGRGDWEQRGSDIDGEATGDGSGFSVSLSSDGSVVAIGTPFNDGNGGGAGHVRLYAWSDGNWLQRGSDIDGEAAGDGSGFSVSLSPEGHVVAIGALGNDANGDSAGHVRLYGWNGRSDWEQRGSDIDGEAAGDQSGFAVSLSSDGRVVAIGANANDDSGDAAGHVRLYAVGGFDVFPEDRNESVDTDQDGIGNNADTDDDGDGVLDRDDAFPLDPTRPVDTSNAAIDADNDGVFDSGGQIGRDIDGEAAGDFSGRSVSLSSDGQVVAIGAYDNDGNGNNAGHVRLYALDDGNWVQRGSDIDGEAAGDTSGHSVSLSPDGNVVAIGAPFNGDNGERSGHVRLYAWDGRDWVQRGADIDGETGNDGSGFSVSLSFDGSVVAIGALGNGANGSGSGHVRLYAWDGRNWVQR
ncbi:hypothetical protein N8993_05695, partial [Pseudomonadales bacterium]|nr:hypothetical protein [Pseudomonadales bacterium]